MSTYLNLKPVEFDKLSAKRKAAVQWEGRILLPKYDGCLALVYLDAGGVLRKIVSRDNKPVRSMDHIAEDLTIRYPWLAQIKEPMCVLGEAWLPGKEFGELSGMFRRHTPQLGLGFAPFDVVSVDAEGKLFSPVPYWQRLARLKDFRHLSLNVFPPSSMHCESKEHAERYAKTLKGMGGYDGAVASDPDAIYQVSDGYGEFLKVKPLLSFSLMVVGCEVAVGEKTGRATGALIVRFKNTTCKVATGLSEAEQANLQSFVGKIIEVGAMGVHPGEEGKLREPRYYGVRDDVITPDY